MKVYKIRGDMEKAERVNYLLFHYKKNKASNDACRVKLKANKRTQLTCEVLAKSCCGF